jgi:hypothetical protein
LIAEGISEKMAEKGRLVGAGSRFIVKEIAEGDVHYNEQIQALCRTPYRGHPRGCPNCEKKRGCPPGAPLIDQVLDLGRGSLFALVTEYNVGEFAERMLKSHPEWKNKMGECYNIIRWQGNERKVHREESRKFLLAHEGLVADENPEGHGVNVTRLLAGAGIALSWASPWPPGHDIKNKVHRVSLAGYPKIRKD